MQRFVEWHRLYLIVAYFCTVYRLTVTFEQLSKYSNIYRAGRAGREGHVRWAGDRHQLVPRACHVSSVPAAAGEGQIWGCSCERTSRELQRYSCGCPGSLCEPPSRHTGTAALTGSATLLSASAAFWKSGCFSCRARVCSRAGEMRKMKGGQSQAPGRVGGSWVSKKGLQTSLPRHRAAGSEIAERKDEH